MVRRLPVGETAAVAGRVILVSSERLLVRDATGNIEVRIAPSSTDVAVGTWARARGTWNGEALVAEAIELTTAPLGAFPRPDGDWTWLQADSGRRAELLRRRADVLGAVREFFETRGFVEVETPLAVPSPGLDLHLSAFEVHGGPLPRFLVTSPEYQMKRLLAGGLSRIFQLCRCFRRDEAGALHEPEFTMLEWYRAFAGSAEIARDTEELVAHVALAVNGTTELEVSGRVVDVAPPWQRMRVDEALERYAGATLTDLVEDEDAFFRTLVETVEPALEKEGPTFLTHWPARFASLARLHPDEPHLADRVEAFIAGVELSNGFGELVDAREQRARLERDDRERAARGLPRYPIDERFLAALEEGIPPSGGNALGVDRLVMLVLGQRRIEDVVAVPSRRL